MGKVGTEWVDLENETLNEEAKMATGKSGRDLSGTSKSELWHEWVEETIWEIHDSDTEDPIPLFETDENGIIELKESGSSTVLKRSAAIDARIRQEGKRCVDENGVKDGPNGLLYLLYQLASDDPSPEDIIPRYIGKAEAYGKRTN